MKKIILTTACAAVLGLASVATASAQFATGANEGMNNTTSMSGTADGRMDAMNKSKKKSSKMMKKDMSGESTGTPSMPQAGGAQKKM